MVQAGGWAPATDPFPRPSEVCQSPFGSPERRGTDSCLGLRIVTATTQAPSVYSTHDDDITPPVPSHRAPTHAGVTGAAGRAPRRARDLPHRRGRQRVGARPLHPRRRGGRQRLGAAGHHCRRRPGRRRRHEDGVGLHQRHRDDHARDDRHRVRPGPDHLCRRRRHGERRDDPALSVRQRQLWAEHHRRPIDHRLGRRGGPRDQR